MDKSSKEVSDSGTSKKIESKNVEPAEKESRADEDKPRRPRRERRADDADEKNHADNEEQPNQIRVENSIEEPKSRPRRRKDNQNEPVAAGGGGWMTVSTEKQPVSKLTIEEEDQKDVANPLNKDKFEKDNDDILVIPDLDEDGYDDDQRVARAPRNITRKVPSLKELETDVKAAIPTVEGGLDLGVLLRTLVPVDLVQEADATWTFDTLLRDVTDELTATSKTVVEPVQSIGPQSPLGQGNRIKEVPLMRPKKSGGSNAGVKE